MEPIDFLNRVEPISISLFESYAHARRAASNEKRSFIHQQQYYAYMVEYRSNIDGGNDDIPSDFTDKVVEAHKALLLADVAAGAVAGALLQIARQCICLAWPTYDERMKKGRLVGSQHLSCVIWHARNQALHFEDGILKNENTLKSIMLLSDEFSIPIENLDESPRALSFEIFDVLGWDSYVSYAKDMVDMLGMLQE